MGKNKFTSSEEFAKKLHAAVKEQDDKLPKEKRGKFWEMVFYQLQTSVGRFPARKEEIDGILNRP